MFPIFIDLGRALETGFREKTRGWSIITQVAHSNFLKKRVGEKTRGGRTKTGKSSSGLQFRESEDVSKSWSWQDHVGDTSAYSVIPRILLTNFNVVQISY